MEERRESYNNNFKSCFPHSEPLIFKGSVLLYPYRTPTVPLPAFWIRQGHFFILKYFRESGLLRYGDKEARFLVWLVKMIPMDTRNLPDFRKAFALYKLCF